MVSGKKIKRDINNCVAFVSFSQNISFLYVFLREMSKADDEHHKVDLLRF